MDPRLTRLDLKTSLLALADIVMPRVCVVCGRVLLPQERHICMCCLADLPQTHFSILDHNPMADKLNSMISGDEYEPYAYATALYYYKSSALYKRISQALKYHRNFGVGRYFARQLALQIVASPLYSDVDAVVPVPLHWTRRYRRGYNQAEIIAKEIASILDAVYYPRLLKRNRSTKTQTKMSGEDKKRNVAEAFSARDHKFPNKSHILLVDDVFTTGATLSACYLALRKCYPTSVRISVATLAVV